MKYDFDELIERRGSNSVKWEVRSEPNMIPMWVADMDFKTAPAIISALQERVSHGIFGYAKVPDTFYEALGGWSERRHNFKISQEWVLNTIGAVPALTAILKALTNKGDKVIVQPPVYNKFFSSIRHDDCEFLPNNLRYVEGRYEMDFEDLELKVSDPLAKVLILCNPHNPVGRVWTKEELTRLGEICLRNNVIVVSDEVHCDLIFSGHKHIPFASLNEDFLQNSVTCVAPSKTFNLAGLQVANIVTANKEIRQKVAQALEINEVIMISPLAITALIAAYDDGEEWLDELLVYIQGNYEYLVSFLKSELPDLKIMDLEGTYLVWIDIHSLGKSSVEVIKTLLKKEQLWINEGNLYGAAGEGFVRINIACPRERLVEGLRRFVSGLKIE